MELEAMNLRDAKAQLRAMADGNLRACRTRFKSGRKHRVNSHSYLITVGRDPRSALWTSLSLQVVNS